jgi:selenide,water dikinase
VDFFTPIVDDPYAYGQIAAANALSDVYAMGGRPLTALAIAAFPAVDFDPAIVRDIFRGGFETLRDAGVALLGGHTVQDSEVKFGYAVTGAVEPERVLSNAGARAGDLLLLTKALGTGIVSTAIKFGRAPAGVAAAAVASMVLLNRTAAGILRDAPQGSVHACTDISGFGLIGHASEMASASRVTFVIEAAAVPLLPGVVDLARRNRTGGAKSNRAHFGEHVARSAHVDETVIDIMYDPQTSGGLLVSLDPSVADGIIDALGRAGVPVQRVGRVVDWTGRCVEIEA